jgi:hypothetical protein
MNSSDTPSDGLTGQQMLDWLDRMDPETAARVDGILAARGPIGAQLFDARQRARLSADELGERAGVDPSVIGGIEVGSHVATRRDLELLGVALDIDFAIGKSSAA